MALGQMATKHRRWNEAEAAYRRALAIDPQNYAALNNLGLVLQRRGRWRLIRRNEAEMLNQYTWAAEQSPTRPTAKKNLWRAAGSVYLRGDLVGGLLLGAWLLTIRHAKLGPDAPTWAANVLWRTAPVRAGFAALFFVIGRYRARNLSDTARRFLREESRRQRWRVWGLLAIGAAYLLAKWGIRWAEDPALNQPRGAYWLLLGGLAAIAGVGAWQISQAVRQRAWHVG